MYKINRYIFNFYFSCTIAILSNLNTYAQQNKCKITGQIVNEMNEPVAYTSVAIFDSSTPVTGGITNTDGHFELKLYQSDKEYTLVAELDLSLMNSYGLRM